MSNKIEISYVNKGLTSGPYLKEGQMGVIEDKRFPDGHVIIRVYDQIISLTDPYRTWSTSARMIVRLLPPGTILTLTVE